MTEDLLMRTMGLALLIGLIGVATRGVIWRRLVTLTRDDTSVVSLCRWAVQQPEIRRRALLTIGILVLLQAAFLIPLPGINVEVLRRLFDNLTMSSEGRIVTRIPLLLTAPVGSAMVFGLGVTPFITACLLLQVGSVVIPPLRRWMFGGEAGRRRLEHASYGLAVGLAILQASAISRWLENPSHFGGDPIVFTLGWPFRLAIVVTMTAGLLVLLAIARFITTRGLGNGIALIVVTGVVVQVYDAAVQMADLSRGGQVQSAGIVIPALLMGAVGYLAYRAAACARPVALQDGAQTVTIPLRLSWVGHEPIGWAQALLLLPVTLAGFGFQVVKGLANFIVTAPWWLSVVVNFFMILPVTMLYTYLVFSPRRVLSQHAALLKTEALRLTWIVGGFLLLVSALPDFIMRAFTLPYFVGHVLGGAGIILVAGVCYDLAAQLAFLKAKSEAGETTWQVCYTALDEIDATIKRQALTNQGIPALVEPIRFTWGLPIRTAVDQYRLHVPTRGRIGE